MSSRATAQHHGGGLSYMHSGMTPQILSARISVSHGVGGMFAASDCGARCRSPAALDHEFGYYGVPDLDTMRGCKEVARTAEILG
jgi:hypothetical protein